MKTSTSILLRYTFYYNKYYVVLENCRSNLITCEKVMEKENGNIKLKKVRKLICDWLKNKTQLI